MLAPREPPERQRDRGRIRRSSRGWAMSRSGSRRWGAAPIRERQRPFRSRDGWTTVRSSVTRAQVQQKAQQRPRQGAGEQRDVAVQPVRLGGDGGRGVADGGEARPRDQRGARALEVVLRLGVPTGQDRRASPGPQPAPGPRLVADRERHRLHLLALAYAEGRLVPAMLQQRLAEVRELAALAETKPQIEVLAGIAPRVVAAGGSQS